MLSKLIVNGDDLGLSQGNSLGIFLAHEEGILTSTTVMMNMPYALWALKKAQAYPKLGIGVHLTATAGKPLTHCPSLMEGENFKKLSYYDTQNYHIDKEELYKEWKAQIEAFKQAGYQPDHLDSHHHIHLYHDFTDVAVTLSQEYHLPMREDKDYLGRDFIPFDQSFYNENATASHFQTILSTHQGVLEIMCHPALIDARMLTCTSYNLPRTKELAILMSDEIKAFIKNNHIVLTNYKEEITHA